MPTIQEISKRLAHIEAHGKEAFETLIANSCRKCAEATAHLIALQSTDVANAAKLQSAIANNSFDKFMQIIENEKLASTDVNVQKRVKAYLCFLQHVANVGSHDNILEKSEHIACVQVLTCLLTWLYDDFLQQNKPDFLLKNLTENVISPIENLNKISIKQEGEKNTAIGENKGTINLTIH